MEKTIYSLISTILVGLLVVAGCGAEPRSQDDPFDADVEEDGDVESDASDGDADGDSDGDADGEGGPDYEGDEPGECDDGADNDRDGLFDCDDDGCAGSPVCDQTDGDADADSDGDSDGDGDGDSDSDSDADEDEDVDEEEEDADIDEDVEEDEEEEPCGGCSTGFTCCDDRCVALDVDEMNCGGCGLQCGSGTDCVSGECLCSWTLHGTDLSIVCDPGAGCCVSDTTGMGECVNLRIGALDDDNWEETTHCGTCNNSCNGWSCREGECCFEYDPATWETWDECPTPEHMLTPDCGGDCGPDGTCCGDRCVDTEQDEMNCGGCGRECGDGATCVEGVCRCLQSSGYEEGVDCRSWGACCREGWIGEPRCVDIIDGVSSGGGDVTHCGGCGTVCYYIDEPPYDSAQECVDAMCYVETDAGYCTRDTDCPDPPAWLFDTSTPTVECRATRCVVTYPPYGAPFGG